MRTTDLENLALAVARGEDVDGDDALELLENEALIDEVCAAGALGALLSLSSLSDGGALWRSTLSLVALRVEGHQGASMALATLYHRAGDHARASRALVASLPATPADRLAWAATAARWTASGDGVGELAAACDDAARECLLASPAWDDDRLGALGVEVPTTPAMATAAARARLRSMSDVATWRVRVAADGRWIGAGARMARSDGLLEVIEPIERSDIPATETVTAMVAAIGGGPIEAARRRTEPALEVIELWQPVVPLRARLMVAGAAFGIEAPILEAASQLGADLDDVELGLFVEPDADVVTPELGLRGRVASLDAAPWVRGTHQLLIGAPARVRATIGRTVSLAIEVDLDALAAPLPPAPAPVPGRGAMTLLAEVAMILASWPATLASSFRAAVLAADPPLLPGASDVERAAHGRALAARFETGGGLDMSGGLLQ